MEVHHCTPFRDDEFAMFIEKSGIMVYDGGAGCPLVGIHYTSGRYLVKMRWHAKRLWRGQGAIEDRQGRRESHGHDHVWATARDLLFLTKLYVVALINEVQAHDGKVWCPDVASPTTHPQMVAM